MDGPEGRGHACANHMNSHSMAGSRDRHARLMREFPRHKAMESRIMSDANSVPGQEEEAAAQTSEKRRS